MSSIDKIEKLTGQYEKEMELVEKHRNKAKEQMELAERHAKRAEDLENQIKYQKGGEVYDRVNALNLSPEELKLLLKLLDDKTQLMDAVQKLFPERLHSHSDSIEAETVQTSDEENEAPVVSEENEESAESGGNGEFADAEPESPYIEETPVFGEDDNDEKGEENWSA